MQLKKHGYDRICLLRLHIGCFVFVSSQWRNIAPWGPLTCLKQRNTRFILARFRFSNEYWVRVQPTILKCPPNFMLEDSGLRLLEALREQKGNYHGVPASPVLTVCARQLHFTAARWNHCRLVNFWSVRLFNIEYRVYRGCPSWSLGSLVYVLAGKLFRILISQKNFTEV